MSIDPGAINLIQTTFLQHLQDAFVWGSRYATNLLYLFAGIELAIFGLIWALQQGGGWDRLFFKVLKIGLIVFIVQNYSYLFHVIIQSFANLGGAIVHPPGLNELIFNPAHIWKYGYNIGLDLIKGAVLSNGVGLTLTLLVLGMGILCVFGLLGIQIVLQIVGFYLIAFISLIFLPFGVFEPTAHMFEKSIQSLLKSGVRVMVLIMVIGVAMITWKTLGLSQIKAPYNINVPLGLFFTTLLFLYLSIKLPKMAASAIGEINLRFLPEKSRESESRDTLVHGQMASSSNLAAVQAASVIEPNLGHMTSSEALGARAMPLSEATATVSSVSQTPLGTRTQKEPTTDLGKASAINYRSISETRLKQIQKELLKIMGEKVSETKDKTLE